MKATKDIPAEVVERGECTDLRDIARHGDITEALERAVMECDLCGHEGNAINFAAVGDAEFYCGRCSDELEKRIENYYSETAA